MTIRYFSRSSIPGPPSVTGAVEIRAVGALTTSYVYTDSLFVAGMAEVSLDLAWNQADETSIEMVMQKADDGIDVADASATWKDITEKDTPSAGVASVYPSVLSLANASFADPSALTLPPIDVTGLSRIRFGFKKTGGASAVTLGVTATAGQLAVGQ